MTISSNIIELTDRIIRAQKSFKTALHRDDLMHQLIQIQSLDDIKTIDASPKDQLWPWLPVIVYSLFGFEAYKNYRPKEKLPHSLLIITPLFVSQKRAIVEALNIRNFHTNTSDFLFTERISALVYGAFPWYKSYLKTCEKHNVFNKKAIALQVHKESVDCIQELLDFKNKHRDTFGAPYIEKFPKDRFDGIINAFHTPNHIENTRHIKALSINY